MRLPGMNDDQTPLQSDARAPDAAPAPTPSSGAVEAPLGVSTPDDDPDATGFAHLRDEGPKRSSTSVLALIALTVVSGAMLWGMRHLGTRGSINLVDISIDYPLAEGGADTTDHVEVIRALNASSEIPQVAPQNIAMNPFTWKAAPKNTVATEDRSAELARREAERLMRALESSAQALKLNSVMRGRVPVANVSGEMVRVGDMIDDTFTVTRIEGREVDIEAEGRTWTLTVGGV